jgi:hypothetical protein
MKRFCSLLADDASLRWRKHMAQQQNRLAREKKIDEALEETFPASDTPSFVGAGPEPKAVAPPKDRPSRQSDNPNDSGADVASMADNE